MIKYGLDWSKAGINDPFSIELQLYEHSHLRENGTKTLSKVEHFRNAFKMVFHDNIFVWSKWANDVSEDYCNYGAISLLGPSSVTKTGMIAAFDNIDFLVAPFYTFIVAVTFPEEEHKERYWGNFLKWRSQLPPHLKLGRTLKDSLRLVLHDQDNNEVKSAGLKCISSRSGESFELLKRKVGGHNKRNRLRVSEPQGCSDMVLKIKNNLGVTGDYNEIMDGNPDTWKDPLGQHCYPLDGNTKKIHEEEPYSYRTKTHDMNNKPGICRILDGRQAPSMKEPKKYWFMLQPNAVKAAAKNEGKNSRYYWTYIIGRIMPGGSDITVIDEIDIDNLGVKNNQVKWLRKPTVWAGLDYGVKDPTVLQKVEVGEAYELGKIALLTKYPCLTPNMKEGDVTGQIAKQVVKKLKDEWHCPITQLAGEESGNQRAFLDRIEVEYGQKGIYRINPEVAASDRYIAGSRDRANERFFNKSTEIIMNFERLIRHRRVFGLNQKIVHQISTRRFADNKKGRQMVEFKKDWRARNKGESPNEMDAAGLVLMMLVEKGIIRPEPSESQLTTYDPFNEPKRNNYSLYRRNKRISRLVNRF